MLVDAESDFTPPLGRGGTPGGISGTVIGPDSAEVHETATRQPLPRVPQIQLPDETRSQILHFNVHPPEDAPQTVADRLGIFVANDPSRCGGLGHFGRIARLDAEALGYSLGRSLGHFLETTCRELSATLRTDGEVRRRRRSHLPHTDTTGRTRRHRGRDILLDHRRDFVGHFIQILFFYGRLADCFEPLFQNFLVNLSSNGLVNNFKRLERRNGECLLDRAHTFLFVEDWR